MKHLLYLFTICLIAFGCNDKETSPDKNVISKDTLSFVKSEHAIVNDTLNVGLNGTTRYFLIAYNFVPKNGSEMNGGGNGEMYIETDRFPSKKYLDSIGRSGMPHKKSYYQEIVITSIFEFKSKEDYQNFSK